MTQVQTRRARQAHTRDRDPGLDQRVWRASTTLFNLCYVMSHLSLSTGRPHSAKNTRPCFIMRLPIKNTVLSFCSVNEGLLLYFTYAGRSDETDAYNVWNELDIIECSPMISVDIYSTLNIDR